MADVRVTCIILSGSERRLEHITHLGGNGWCWTREQVIQSIETGTNTFYVMDSSGRRANLIVVNTQPKYVRTTPDGTVTDNLLSLPPCR